MTATEMKFKCFLISQMKFRNDAGATQTQTHAHSLPLFPMEDAEYVEYVEYVEHAEQEERKAEQAAEPAIVQKSMILLLGGEAEAGKTFFSTALANFCGRDVQVISLPTELSKWDMWSDKGLKPQRFSKPAVHPDQAFVSRVFEEAADATTTELQILLQIRADVANKDDARVFVITCYSAEHARKVFTSLRAFVPERGGVAFATLHLLQCERHPSS